MSWVAETEQHCPLKDYIVFRVDQREASSRELAGESALELEAVRFTQMICEVEADENVCFEVRLSRNGELVHLSSAGARSPGVELQAVGA